MADSSGGSQEAVVLRLVVLPRRRDDRVELLSLYAEYVFPALAGPTSLLVLRRLARMPAGRPSRGDVEIDTAELAAGLGVRPRRLIVALDRLIALGLISRVPGGIGMTGYAPTLTDHQLARLPSVVVAAHHRLLDAS